MRIPAELRALCIGEAIKNGMKCLTYDIETSHMLVRTFYIGRKVSISHKQIKVPSKVITIQLKWAHLKKPTFLSWRRVSHKYQDVRDFDDTRMLLLFINRLKEADITITQNGDSFDFKTLNDRVKTLQIKALPQKPSWDILKSSKTSFRTPSHKLDARSEQQGLGGKRKMEDDDWVDIEERGISPTKKMVPYGLKDSTDTETLALKKELLYYKAIPYPVEKVILSFLTLEFLAKHSLLSTQVYCQLCRSKKTLSTNLRFKKNSATCNSCGERWEVK